MVDFADFRSLFTKAHSFGCSVFGRLPRDFWHILLGSSENGRDPRLWTPACETSIIERSQRALFVNEKVFKKISKNNHTLHILFSWDWHNKSTLHCNSFNSLGQATTFEFSFFRIPILLAFFSAKSANPTLFRMRILLTLFSVKSANSTVFRIPILLVTESFLCEAYRFQKTFRLQMPKRML